ncbi:MAG: hypothetical protein KAJ33_05305 [Thermoplasmata archaeon]|nr:hypothetical protein [Thermoplasmata archaeon]
MSIDLTALDKILLHLKDNWHHRNDKEYPVSITQKGISEATGLRLSHVPRTLKTLAERELVKDIKGHVKGEKRRYKSYFLTDKGLAEVKSVLEHIKGQTVSYDGKETQVSEILAKEKTICILPLMLTLAGEASQVISYQCKMAGPIPSIEGFVNREAELENLGQMLEKSQSKITIIYGSQGYGTSTLASKFLDLNNSKWSAAWVPMHNSFPAFKKEMEKTLCQLIPDIELELERPEELAAQLDNKKIILVMDNYFEATDDLVEYLTGFIAAIKEIEGFNLLVTARENTPSYERFYTIMDIHDGTVNEVHIRGLDIEHCQEILGVPDIDPEAMKRLYMFTMGKPPTLKLLAREDVEAMKQHTKFSPEEIKLMLYLKGQRV